MYRVEYDTLNAHEGTRETWGANFSNATQAYNAYNVFRRYFENVRLYIEHSSGDNLVLYHGREIRK